MRITIITLIIIVAREYNVVGDRIGAWFLLCTRNRIRVVDKSRNSCLFGVFFRDRTRDGAARRGEGRTRAFPAVKFAITHIIINAPRRTSRRRGF